MINKGLEGVVVAETAISHVDGIKGELLYAGYSLEKVIESNPSYEDVLYLLLNGEFPTTQASVNFPNALKKERNLLQPNI